MNDELCRSETLIESPRENQLLLSVQLARLPWNRPVLTLISLKRTLFLNGSINDGNTGSQAPN